MRYRKKPVEIEAVQFTRDLAFKMFAGKADGPFGLAASGDYHLGRGEVYRAWISIETREGIMRADIDDWIIKGIAGELYPCKPDIFAATYEPA